MYNTMWMFHYLLYYFTLLLSKIWTWSTSDRLTPPKNQAHKKAYSLLSATVGAVPNQGWSDSIPCSCYLIVWLLRSARYTGLQIPTVMSTKQEKAEVGYDRGKYRQHQISKRIKLWLKQFIMWDCFFKIIQYFAKQYRIVVSAATHIQKDCEGWVFLQTSETHALCLTKVGFNTEG